MSLSDELERLAALRERGVLTDAEFEAAKGKLLDSNAQAGSSGSPMPGIPPFQHRSDETLGRAANRYVSFQIVMAVVGILIFLFFFAPMMCSSMPVFHRGP